jgi:hypothetical protein
LGMGILKGGNNVQNNKNIAHILKQKCPQATAWLPVGG